MDTDNGTNEHTILPPDLRRSSRAVIKPAWHHDYVTTKKGHNPHSLSNYVSYQTISPTYKACLSHFSAITEPKSYEEALLDDKWKDAMQQELQALKENGTWNLVPCPQGKPVIGCKWAFNIKHKVDGTVERYKARLMAKGYNQTAGIDYQSSSEDGNSQNCHCFSCCRELVYISNGCLQCFFTRKPYRGSVHGTA